VSDASVRRAGEQASGTFRYEPGQELVELDLVFSGHRMADYRWIGIPDPLEGTVRDGEISVRGARARPRIEGRVELDGFRVGRQAFPTASIRLETSGPLLHAVVETDRGLDVSADIEIETEGLPFSGEGSFRAFDIGELAGLDAGAAAATGEVAFTGQLTDLATLEGQGTVTSLSALFEGQALEVTRPFPFAFNTRQVDVQRLELTSGEAAPLELSGTIAIERDAPLDLSVFGPIDLSVLENRYPGLEAGGTVQLEAWIEGTVADPLLGGVAILTDVSLGHDSAFLGVSGLRGDVFLDGPRASLTVATGR
jgi:autotransporter translocation and assembly factor TamB